jgi:hypothetical protein
MEPIFFALAIAGTYVVVAGAGLIVAKRKHMPRSELTKQLGPAYFIVEASSSRIALRVQRDDRVFEAKISLGGGESRWFVTSARPHSYGSHANAAAPGLKDDLERIMARGRAQRLTMINGDMTVAILRGISAVDIEEAIDTAAELAALIDRERPSAVEMDVDASLFANEPRDAVSGTSGAPFGVSTGDRS